MIWDNIDELTAHIRKTMLSSEDGDIPMHFMMQFPNEQAVAVLITPLMRGDDMEKKFIQGLVAIFIEQHSVKEYFYASTAWMSTRKIDDEDDPRNPKVMPSKDPNRKEILVVSHFHESEPSETRLFLINREDDALIITPFIEPDKGSVESVWDVFPLVKGIKRMPPEVREKLQAIVAKMDINKELSR